MATMTTNKRDFYAGLYADGTLSAALVQRAVEKGWLTQAEADEITADEQ